jgi:hypothetical protein
MTIDQREIWFRAKRYGWGWGLPVALQGWLVLAGYVLLVTVGASTLPRQHPILFVVYITCLTIVLVAVCWLKGEKPGWRWGGK